MCALHTLGHWLVRYGLKLYQHSTIVMMFFRFVFSIFFFIVNWGLSCFVLNGHILFISWGSPVKQLVIYVPIAAN